MNVASTWRRLIAYLIDRFFVFVLYSPVWVQGLSGFLSEKVIKIDIFWILICFLFQFLFRLVFLVVLGGGPGKLFLGLRVVDVNSNKNVGWIQGFVRVLTEHLSFVFGTSLQIFALCRFDRRHVVDWIAETQVRQFIPRNNFPRPRFILPILLSIYVSISAFKSTYHTFQRTEFERNQIIIHPF